MYPYQRWNEIRMPRRGCVRGKGTADVYHKSHCPPLTEFVEPPSLPPRHIQRTRRERKRERATRATRCKTLPVNFIALGTSSYTSTCTTRYLPILGQEPPPPPRLLIRSGVNLTAGTFRRTRTHTPEAQTRTGPYIVVIACVHTGRAAARVFTTDGG